MDIKIPFYNVLNMFLTGFVFIGCLLVTYSEGVIAFIKSEMFSKLTTISELLLFLIVCAVSYEVGLILNRFSSVVVEPILKKTRLIPFDERYSRFVEKSRKYPIMHTLSREYALSRTGVGEFMILAVISVMKSNVAFALLLLGISVIYLLSCRKHAAKIVKLMQNE
ncbi:MAG: hypothetical protein E7269_08280 [Lachnospiraceae bacterium]|nr:hypothetical protein [Lachnospiraceae bacterium]